MKQVIVYYLCNSWSYYVIKSKTEKVHHEFIGDDRDLLEAF